MRVAVAGVGYVGASVAAGMVEMGHEVLLFDIDEDLIRSFNKDDGLVPDVPGPDARQVLDSDRVVASLAPDVLLEADVVFLCLPTPNTDGELNTDSIHALVETVDFSEQTLVIKSTVTPGTCRRIDEKTADSVVVGHNPEFLRQGQGFHDFMEAQRFVFGGSGTFHEVMDELYSSHPQWTYATVAHVDWETAEMAKLANNTFLAAKISLANELASITEGVDGDGRAVMEIVSADDRIGRDFTTPGPPWGGDCLPKDVKGLKTLAADEGIVSNMVSATQFSNEDMVYRTVAKVDELDGQNIGLLGLAFKPGDESTTESFARALVPHLHDNNYFVYGADRSPRAVEEMKSDFADVLFEDAQTVIAESDIVVITTGHPEWSSLEYGDTTVVDPTGRLREEDISNYHDLFR
jgi:UDPglucose 6-dehydrogenase